jgi:hypothetical protein
LLSFAGCSATRSLAWSSSFTPTYAAWASATSFSLAAARQDRHLRELEDLLALAPQLVGNAAGWGQVGECGQQKGQQHSRRPERCVEKRFHGNSETRPGDPSPL